MSWSLLGVKKKNNNKVYYDVTITSNCANEKQSVPT